MREQVHQAWSAALQLIEHTDPFVAKTMEQELVEQRRQLKLIASENYASPAVLLAMGSWLSDKYAEGVPGSRYYAGCEQVDRLETHACTLARTLFQVEHAYVQPHSGADANLVAYHAILTECVQQPMLKRLGKRSLDQLTAEEFESLRHAMHTQRLMGMALDSGGHLTHGYRLNSSGRMFECASYAVDPITGWLDLNQLEEQVLQFRPQILVAGYSAYPRRLQFDALRRIADQVGAVLLVDMAHFSGLVAGGVLQGTEHPAPYADLITSTTHKTLRGPRGGMVLCTQRWASAVDKGCPTVLGGPMPHVIAAKALCFQEASQPSFQEYAHQVVRNAQALASELLAGGVSLLTGGTDNHLVMLRVYPTFGISGRQAEQVLMQCGIASNRNTLPLDPLGPLHGSGIRLGTPAVTTLGMREGEMRAIATLILEALRAAQKIASGDHRAPVQLAPEVAAKIRSRVGDLMDRYPLYPELTLNEDHL